MILNSALQEYPIDLIPAIKIAVNASYDYHNFVCHKTIENNTSIYCRQTRDTIFREQARWEGANIWFMEVHAFITWLLYNDKVSVTSIYDITTFLKDHQDMVDDILVPVFQSALPKFDHLTFSVNRENGDEYLILYARQRDYTDQFIDDIESIQEEYVDKLSGKSAWFLLTTDFETPEQV